MMEIECEELQRQLEALVDRELDPGTAGRMGAHLRACSHCSRVHQEAVSIPFRLRALKSPAPPPSLVPDVLRAVRPSAADGTRAWMRPQVWAPLLAEGGLAGVLGLYLSGAAGVAALARTTLADLGALWAWSVGSSNPPTDLSTDLVVVVGALLLMVVTIYHLVALARQRGQSWGQQT